MRGEHDKQQRCKGEADPDAPASGRSEQHGEGGDRRERPPERQAECSIAFTAPRLRGSSTAGKRTGYRT